MKTLENKEDKEGIYSSIIGFWGACFSHLMMQRLLLCAMLAVLILYSFTGETIPHNEGLGWDGTRYYYFMVHFDELIFNHGIDSYRITRLLPFLIIRYVMQLVNVEMTVSNVLIASKIYNAFILVFLLIYFFKLAKVAMWNRYTEIIAFSFVFFNFPVLKFFGYYPLLADCSALLLSFMAVYYFYVKNYIGMLVVALLSLVTWPILSVVVFVLAVFPRDSVERIHTNSQLQQLISLLVRSIFVFFVPFLFLFFALRLHLVYPEMDVYHYIYKCRFPINYWSALIAIIGICFFYYFATKELNINWYKLFRAFLRKAVIARIILFAVLFVVIFREVTSLGGDAKWSLSNQILSMVSLPTTDFLIFLETHFMYLGLFFLLIVLRWNDVVVYVREKLGIGYFLVLLLSLLLLMDIETRKLTQFYPILLLPLMACVQKLKLKKSFHYMVPVVCLIGSFFWFNINTPDIAGAFNQPSTFIDIDSPAQRYFMFIGPWQSRTVYLIVSMVELTLFFVIYFMHKRGVLYEE